MFNSKFKTMKTLVEFYMKGKPRQTKEFDTQKEAFAFMSALAENEECEAYGIVRR